MLGGKRGEERGRGKGESIRRHKHQPVNNLLTRRTKHKRDDHQNTTENLKYDFTNTYERSSKQG